MNLKIALIGTGALGKSLGAHFFPNDKVIYFGRKDAFWEDYYGNKHQIHGLDLKKESIKELFYQCDVVFIATQDQQIHNVIEQIKAHVKAPKWILHGSGSVSANVLDVLKTNSQIKTGVIHFLQTFYEESHLNPNVFNGISASVMGDLEIIDWLDNSANIKRINLINVTEEQKKQLHIAAIFACNFLHVLMDAANKIAQIDGQNAIQILAPLIRTSLNSIFENGAITTLSGPIKRGDSQVIASHIDYLKDKPEIQQVYKELSTYLINRLKDAN